MCCGGCVHSHIDTLQIGGNLDGSDVVERHGLEPHRLPDATAGCVGVTAGLVDCADALLSKDLPAIVGWVVDSDQKLVCGAVRVEIVCDIKVEPVVARKCRCRREWTYIKLLLTFTCDLWLSNLMDVRPCPSLPASVVAGHFAIDVDSCQPVDGTKVEQRAFLSEWRGKLLPVPHVPADAQIPR